MSVLERLKKLEEQQQKLNEQRAEIAEQAKTELLDDIKGKITELNSLGFNYRLAQDGKSTKTGITRQRDPNAPCDVCGFATIPGHDGRKHRAQGEQKKPFTVKELEELGLKKK